MAADHPSASTTHKRKRGLPPVSKTELKMSLVAKRLSMLQDDDDMKFLEGAEDPRQNESEQIREKSVINLPDDNGNKLSCSQQKICGRSVDSSPEDIVCKSSATRRKYRSIMRLKMVISDDEESLEDRKFSVKAEPRKKESIKRLKMVISDEESSEDRKFSVKAEPRKKGRVIKNDSALDNKNLKTTTNSKKNGSRRRELSDSLPLNTIPSSMKRAEEVQANLSAEYPSIVKLMLKSHVSGGFWLGLPKKFCDKHLPNHDSTMVLVDEDGNESNTKYLAEKVGLSGGWRGFSIDHDLHEGDVVVFHLIAPTTFKVYIVRADGLGEIDGAVGLLNLDACARQLSSEDQVEKVVNTEEHYPLLNYPSQSNSDEDLGAEVLDDIDGLHFSDSVVNFEGIRGFEDFNIIVDGLVIDSKFPNNVRKKYYDLCCTQKSYLHDQLLKGLNCNLVVGIISETINIYDAIKACKSSSTTSHEDLQIWEQTLKGFEHLGMKVAFLRARLSLLLGVDLESDMADESNRFEEARLERARAGDRMRALESKLKDMKEMMEKIDVDIEAEIKSSAKIKEIVNAPWLCE